MVSPLQDWLVSLGCNQMHKDDSESFSFCQGASLASIEDPSEQEFIKKHLKIFEDSHSSFWIGLFKNHRGTVNCLWLKLLLLLLLELFSHSLLGEWKWFDGSVMDYENWGNDQPLEHSYVEISASDGIWLTAKTEAYRPYICKKRKGKNQATVSVMMTV